jgi:putative RNA 2'-phosphotransferase
VNAERERRISKFLSLILRHQPEKIGLTLEKDGWANVEDLLAACRKNNFAFSADELKTVVADNDKKRFSFDETGAKIRANQGHSVRVEIDFEKKHPPEILYHGTAEKNAAAILENGLRKMRRHHVHLSEDQETARKVGARYGKPIIFEIDAKAMAEENFVFYISANDVWLVEAVPAKFLKAKK